MSTRDGAAGRKIRIGAMSALLIGAATVSLAVVAVLADRFAVRIDVTATRQQALSPRTLALLRGIDKPYEIVVAADSRAVDRRSLERIGDVLDQFRIECPTLKYTAINTATAGGVEEYQRLLARLAERESGALAARRGAIESGVATARELADALEALSPRLDAVREAITPEAPGADRNRQFFEHRAAEARLSARTLRDVAGRAQQALDDGRNSGPLPAPGSEESVGALLEALTGLETGLRAFAENARDFAAAEAQPALARDLAAPIARELAAHRDRVGVATDALNRLGVLDVTKVARVLERTDAAIVIGPAGGGLTAIPFDWLAPARGSAEGGAVQADLRRKNEELFGAALDSLANPVNPIAVVVHSLPARFFERSGSFASLIERLSLRGVDVVEWAAAIEETAPSLSRLNPKGDRPVVYVSLTSDTTVGGGSGRTGAERADKLGAVLARLAEDGKPLLISMSPSALPTFGSPDRTVAPLALFGLEADTGRPLLSDVITPRGRAIELIQSAIAQPGSHPIAAAVAGLRTGFEWAIALRVKDDQADVTALYSLDSPSVWGESQWLALWQSQQGPEGRRSLPPTLPANDSSGDNTERPWMVAAAATRRTGDGRTARLVAVGSNTWFADAMTRSRVQDIDGRAVAAYPGNIELFEASLYWLAGQDHRVGQSPTAHAVPVIRPLDPGTLTALRWLLAAGTPALVLLAGAAWRAARG